MKEINNASTPTEANFLSPLLIAGGAAGAGFLAGKKSAGEPKIIEIVKNVGSSGQTIDPAVFSDPFLFDWKKTAFDRSSAEYFYHSAFRPVSGIVNLLMNHDLNKEQRSRLRARMINILQHGGSWFGVTSVLAQKVVIDRGYKVLSETKVNNAMLGKNGKRKTQSQDVAAFNAYCNTLALVDLDLLVAYYSQHKVKSIELILTLIKDDLVRKAFSSLYDIKYEVYENSISQQFAWIRGEEVKHKVYSFADQIINAAKIRREERAKKRSDQAEKRTIAAQNIKQNLAYVILDAENYAKFQSNNFLINKFTAPWSVLSENDILYHAQYLDQAEAMKHELYSYGISAIIDSSGFTDPGADRISTDPFTV